MQYPGAPDGVKFNETLRSLINCLVSGMVTGTLAAANEAGVDEVEAVRQHPQRLIRMTSDVQVADAELKRFLAQTVYHSETVQAARNDTAGMIPRLFRYLVENPESMPESTVAQLDELPVHRVVCDYVAGMTDTYLQRVYEQIFGQSS